MNLKIIELEKALEEAIKRFKGDKEYFNYILGATALGIAMANADGEIVSEERQEIEEFIGGIANSNYPEYIRHLIEKLYETKPSFNEAMIYVEKIDPSNYESLRNLLEVVALADGIKHETEVAFLRAFDSSITKVKYVPELEDNQKEFLLARLTE
ncbi:MAG: TerB family tellurite resistance protein [Arcobacteraceae bacterium]